MSRIEELPDDFDESINLNEAPNVPSIEDLYQEHLKKPRKDPITDRSFEELVQDMSKTPLFMNSLEDATDDGTT